MNANPMSLKTAPDPKPSLRPSAQGGCAQTMPLSRGIHQTQDTRSGSWGSSAPSRFILQLARKARSAPRAARGRARCARQTSSRRRRACPISPPARLPRRPLVDVQNPVAVSGDAHVMLDYDNGIAGIRRVGRVAQRASRRQPDEARWWARRGRKASGRAARAGVQWRA